MHARACIRMGARDGRDIKAEARISMGSTRTGARRTVTLAHRRHWKVHQRRVTVNWCQWSHEPQSNRCDELDVADAGACLYEYLHGTHRGSSAEAGRAASAGASARTRGAAPRCLPLAGMLRSPGCCSCRRHQRGSYRRGRSAGTLAARGVEAAGACSCRRPLRSLLAALVRAGSGGLARRRRHHSYLISHLLRGSTLAAPAACRGNAGPLLALPAPACRAHRGRRRSCHSASAFAATAQRSLCGCLRLLLPFRRALLLLPLLIRCGCLGTPATTAPQPASRWRRRGRCIIRTRTCSSSRCSSACASAGPLPAASRSHGGLACALALPRTCSCRSCCGHQLHPQQRVSEGQGVARGQLDGRVALHPLPVVLAAVAGVQVSVVHRAQNHGELQARQTDIEAGASCRQTRGGATQGGEEGDGEGCAVAAWAPTHLSDQDVLLVSRYPGASAFHPRPICTHTHTQAPATALTLPCQVDTE